MFVFCHCPRYLPCYCPRYFLCHCPCYFFAIVFVIFFFFSLLFSLSLLCVIVLVSVLLINIPECPCWWSHCPLLDFFCHQIHFSSTCFYFLFFSCFTDFVLGYYYKLSSGTVLCFLRHKYFHFFPLSVVLTLSWACLKHSNMSYRVSFVMDISSKFQVQKITLEPSSRLSSRDFESLGDTGGKKHLMPSRKMQK